MQLNEKIKVVLAEDEIVLREEIASKIQAIDPDFVVAAQESNGLQALQTMRRLDADVLISDIKMPEMDGIELINTVYRQFPKVKIVILSGYSDFQYMQQAMKAGVRNYLLKPVDEEALRSTLAELKNEIIADQYYHNRTVIYSRQYHTRSSGEVQFAAMCVCMGNLCWNTSDAYLRHWFSQHCRVSWQPVMEQLEGEWPDWSVSDEEIPNISLLLFRVEKGSACGIRALAGRVQALLHAQCPEQPVTVAYSQYLQNREDIWLSSVRLRKLLHQQVVAAQSALLELEKWEKIPPQSDLLDVVKLRVNEQLRQSIESKDYEKTEDELRMIFGYLIEQHVPQQDVQKIVSYIIRMCEFSGIGGLDALQNHVLREVCCASEAPQLLEKLIAAVMQGLRPSDGRSDLGTQLVDYVDHCYVQMEHLEDVTKVFHYNYAYLSRLFKKQTGTTLNRYVLEKKLELAKQLIENNDFLSMTQISGMAGFTDRRYFLRAFKEYTGMSPSEYKQSIILKG